MTNTLTKENFWDEMSQKYPKAMKHFGDWIDRYKEDVKWNYFFGAGHKNAHDYHAAPKYHQLPIAMQFGIFYQYMAYWRDKDGTMTEGGTICSVRNIPAGMRMFVSMCFTIIEFKLGGKPCQ